MWLGRLCSICGWPWGQGLVLSKAEPCVATSVGPALCCMVDTDSHLVTSILCVTVSCASAFSRTTLASSDSSMDLNVSACRQEPNLSKKVTCLGAMPFHQAQAKVPLAGPHSNPLQWPLMSTTALLLSWCPCHSASSVQTWLYCHTSHETRKQFTIN